MKRLFVFFVLFVSFVYVKSASAEDAYYTKPCTVQATDAKDLAILRDKGYTFSTIREHIEKDFPSSDQDALLNVLSNIFTALKERTSNEVYEAALFSCVNHGKPVQPKPLSEPSFSTPRGYLSEKEQQSCSTLGSWLETAVNQLTASERQLDGMQSSVDASYARLNALANPPDSMVAEHNTRVSELRDKATEYTALADTYNKESIRYNRECGGKAIR